MDRITLAHGSGGRLMHQLIDSLFIKEFDSKILRQKKDSAVVRVGNKELAFTTDSYVVNPIFFPGGDIASLAVYGTVNDLAVCGARPMYMSLGFIIEEGFDRKLLEKLVRSARSAAKKAAVEIVTGDTKVVEKGSCDRIFLNTSGIGELYYKGLDPKRIKSGDAVIVSGTIGEHAISVLSKREGIGFKTAVRSDSGPLNSLIGNVLKVTGKVKFMRDPTRGGLATTLNEMVEEKDFGIALDEKEVPVSDGVRNACELLGFDPLYLACEGRVVIIAAKEDALKVLNAMRRHASGRKSNVIGEVSAQHKGMVYMKTLSGGKRLVDMLSGEQLPRIC